MEYKDFLDLHGQSVEIRWPDGRVTGTIDAVDRLSDNPVAQRTPFSVLVSTPLEPALAQGTYEILAEGRDIEVLFMVPLGPRDDRMHYEIVFN